MQGSCCFERVVETAPIRTVEELLSYESAKCAYSRRPRALQPLPQRRRMLVCHDMKGNYLEDRFDNGGRYSDPFQLYHWDLIDIFVYFSHNFVTIPPRSWVTACHKHNTLVLGTFITEWDEGAKICTQLFESVQSAHMLARKLADIALDYGFDGWLINIENAVDAELIPNVQCFLAELRSILHNAHASSLVLWYDSITCDGELSWQDTLNDKNKPFFDVSDGIFTNYCWKEEFPQQCLALAGERNHDVYFGIDVFGRGTYGGGQYNCDIAVNVIREADVSTALFAPGWVLEHEMGTQEATDENFDQYQQELETKTLQFWSPIAKAWQCSNSVVCASTSNHGNVVSTNFSAAVGQHLWLSSFQTNSSAARYDPGMQGVCATFPACPGENLGDWPATAIDFQTVFDGLSSLRLHRQSSEAATPVLQLDYSLASIDGDDLIVRVVCGPAEEELPSFDLAVRAADGTTSVVSLDDLGAISETLAPMTATGSLHWSMRTYLLGSDVLSSLGNGAAISEVRYRKRTPAEIAAYVGGLTIGPQRSIALDPIVSATCKGLTVSNIEMVTKGHRDESDAAHNSGVGSTTLRCAFTLEWEAFKLETNGAAFDAHTVDVLAISDDILAFTEVCPFEQSQVVASHELEEATTSGRGSLRLTVAASPQLISTGDGHVELRNFEDNLVHVCRTDDTQCRIGFCICEDTQHAVQPPSPATLKLGLLLVPAGAGFQRPPLSACPMLYISLSQC